MSVARAFKAAAAAAILIAACALAASCKVDKAALAKQVDLHDVNLSSVPDGTYEAAYTITPPAGSMAANTHVRVRVTVSAGRYQKIELLEPRGLAGSRTAAALGDRILERQQLSTDAISGATITSTAILKAVQEAVSSAGK